MKKTFTLEEIERAISQSPKHIVDIKTPPNIDGNLDSEIETMEIDMFLFRLFGSNKNTYDYYKLINKSK
jgi:type II restriction/modification system DNA methylase subunit YeeA